MKLVKAKSQIPSQDVKHVEEVLVKLESFVDARFIFIVRQMTKSPVV